MNIPYGRQNISQSDIDSVYEVLQSDWLTQGPSITRFEEQLQSNFDVRFATVVSSATAALHIACLSLGLKEGDYLWTSANTFVASANCGLYCGALVDFVDIELDNYNICIDALEDKLIKAEKEGKLPKIVIAVHFSGKSCDMHAIKELSNKYGFHIIEDASHAVGATYDNGLVGSCKYSDITVFSFHPVKIITTGEGGVALTNNPITHEKLTRLRSHGITRNKDQLNENHGAWYYEQHHLGFNYRMTDIQAALGSSQLVKLNTFLERRHHIHNEYSKLLDKFPLKLTKKSDVRGSSLHLYPVLVDDPSDRKPLFDYLRKNNIGVNVHYIPVYKQPFFQSLGFSYDYCVNAEFYYQREISLPMFPGLTQQDLQRVKEVIDGYFE